MMKMMMKKNMMMMKMMMMMMMMMTSFNFMGTLGRSVCFFRGESLSVIHRGAEQIFQHAAVKKQH